MKRSLLTGIIAIIALFALISLLTSHAADTPSQGTYEYTTIRWGGRENTHVIRPSGEVEFVGNQLKNLKRPDRADDRSFYMNVVMNGLAREGWELAGMTSDDIVMRRAKR
jgi:hypothetical protein